MENKKKSPTDIKYMKNFELNINKKLYDSNNPFGVNYEGFDKRNKTYYKFNVMKDYIILDKEDAEKIMNSNFILYSKCSFVGLIFLTPFLIYNRFKKINPLIYNMTKFFSFFTGASFSYHPFFFRSVDLCYKPLIDKYLDIAVENGFEDYEISRDRFVSSFFVRMTNKYLI